MKRTTLFTIFATLVAVGLNPLSLLAQGSLTPPGPPGPTMKTLDQVEARVPIGSVPYTITNSGSYYFTTNLADRLGTNGIIIAASFVTLDLNGFALFGGPLLLPGRPGILVQGPQRHIIIRNGTVARWTGGTSIDASDCTQLVCERLNIFQSGGFGIRTGKQCLIRDCVVKGSWYDGIFAGSGLISGCVVEGNETGIDIFDGQVRGCLISANSDDGIDAVNSTVIDCDILNDGFCGVRVEDAASQILNNRISGHTNSPSYGIVIYGHHNRVEGNFLTGNSVGVYTAGTNNLVVRNTLSANTKDWSLDFPEHNTAPAPIAPGSAITSASPWANVSH